MELFKFSLRKFNLKIIFTKNKMYSITPEVMMNDDILYLIKVDGEEHSFTKSKEEAKLIIDSLAQSYIKEYKKEYSDRKIYREEEEDCIRVLTQSSNVFYTNAPKVRVIINFIPVGFSFLTRNRFELIKSENISTNASNNNETNIPVAPPAPKLLSISELRRYAREKGISVQSIYGYNPDY